MKRAILAAVIALPLAVLAQAKPAAKPGTVPEAECDMHKSFMGIVSAATAARGKAEVYDMNDGHALLIWAGETRGAAAMDAAVEQINATMKSAQDGKAKLCDFHAQVGASSKAGKTLVGVAKLPMGYLISLQSADAAVVKAAHEQSAKMKAMSMAPAAPAATPDPAATK